MDWTITYNIFTGAIIYSGGIYNFFTRLSITRQGRECFDGMWSRDSSRSRSRATEMSL